MTRTSYFCKQILEVFVSVLIALPFEMKMVVAEFMLDDADQFIHPEFLEVLRIYINMMGLEHVAAPCRPETRVEIGLMTERPFKQTFG